MIALFGEGWGVGVHMGDSHASATPCTQRQMEFQLNNGQFHDIPHLRKDTAWPVAQFHPRFCDHRNH